jgi:DNA-binding NtrC family response regulator
MEMKVLMESIQKTLSNMESKLTVSTPEKRKTAEPITKEHDEKTTEPKPTASPTATPKKQNTTKPYTEQDAIDELNRDYEESQREFTEEDKRNYIRDAARKLGFPEKEIDEELGKSND